MFNTEKLEVWHTAIEFADSVYAITRSFPGGEQFGLTNQMRRSAVSISSNIAEGSSRNSRKDFARFVEIATGCVFEVLSQSFIARNQGLLPPADFQNLYATAEEPTRMLSGRRRTLLDEKPASRPDSWALGIFSQPSTFNTQLFSTLTISTACSR